MHTTTDFSKQVLLAFFFAHSSHVIKKILPFGADIVKKVGYTLNTMVLYILLPNSLFLPSIKDVSCVLSCKYHTVLCQFNTVNITVCEISSILNPAAAIRR